MHIDRTLRMSREADPDRNAGSGREWLVRDLLYQPDHIGVEEPVCGESSNAGLSYPRRVDIIFRVGCMASFSGPEAAASHDGCGAFDVTN
jgi:hypothetical protein